MFTRKLRFPNEFILTRQWILCQSDDAQQMADRRLCVSSLWKMISRVQNGRDLILLASHFWHCNVLPEGRSVVLTRYPEAKRLMSKRPFSGAYYLNCLSEALGALLAINRFSALFFPLQHNQVSYGDDR